MVDATESDITKEVNKLAFCSLSRSARDIKPCLRNGKMKESRGRTMNGANILIESRVESLNNTL